MKHRGPVGGPQYQDLADGVVELRRARQRSLLRLIASQLLVSFMCRLTLQMGAAFNIQAICMPLADLPVHFILDG